MNGTITVRLPVDVAQSLLAAAEHVANDSRAEAATCRAKDCPIAADWKDRIADELDIASAELSAALAALWGEAA